MPASVGETGKYESYWLGGAAMAVAAGWYVALVELWPASSRAGTRWAAATSAAQGAASLQLASGEPVIALGGFSGSDPAPTLAEFRTAVTAGRVRYDVEGGGPGGPGARDAAAA